MLLSIIIPCYNSSRFLDKTLDMLISQGLDNCEVIIVNDGSTDETSAIAHSYESRIKDLKVIDKENEGVSVARNIGVKNAKGKYIYFFDSDDSLIESTLDFYRNRIIENENVPFFAFAYKSINESGKQKNYCFQKFNEKKIDKLALQKIYLTKRISFHICSCLFRRDFLLENNIVFNEGQKIGEDVCFLLKVISRADCCLYSSRVSYLYQIRSDSAMQGYKNVYNYDRFIVFERFFNACEPFYKSKIMFHYSIFFLQISLLKNIYRYLRSDFVDERITNDLINYCDLFKHRPSFGYFPIFLVLCFARVLPLRFILQHKRK